MNYKFLPIGGNDWASPYPVSGTFAGENQELPVAPVAPYSLRAEDQPAARGTGEDYMIGSPRAVGATPDDWMIGSPRAVGDPGEAGTDHTADAADDPALRAAYARYEAAVVALEERSYDTPFNDTMMAAPDH